MEVLSPRPLPLEFALPKNTELRHAKERCLFAYVFTRFFDVRNPRNPLI